MINIGRLNLQLKYKNCQTRLRKKDIPLYAVIRDIPKKHKWLKREIPGKY